MRFPRAGSRPISISRISFPGSALRIRSRWAARSGACAQILTTPITISRITHTRIFSVFAYDDPLQVTRKVDPRTGLPATNVVGLRGFEWSLFFNDDWKVKRNLPSTSASDIKIRIADEINGQLRNLVLGSELRSTNVWRMRRYRQKFLPGQQQRFCPASGVRLESGR